VPAMTTRELFEFVTDPTINQTNIDSYLETVFRLFFFFFFFNI
jgi:hypothetical protein